MPSCERRTSTAPGGGVARGGPAGGEAAAGAPAGGGFGRGAGAAAATAGAGFAAAGAAAASSAGAAARAPGLRTVAMRSPVLTVPPLPMCTFSMTPSAVDGTSMLAFSDSSVTSGVSTATLSPGLTRMSMTATSLKLPMSGTRTSVSPAASFMGRAVASDLPRHGLLGIHPERLDGTADGRMIDAAVVGERLQRRHGDIVAIHLEMAAQCRARIRAAVAVGAERHVAAVDPLADLVGHDAHVVGRRHHRSLVAVQHLPHVGHARGFARVQQVPALDLERLAAQLAETGDRHDVRRDAVVVFQDLRRRQG